MQLEQSEVVRLKGTVHLFYMWVHGFVSGGRLVLTVLILIVPCGRIRSILYCHGSVQSLH